MSKQVINKFFTLPTIEKRWSVDTLIKKLFFSSLAKRVNLREQDDLYIKYQLAFSLLIFNVLASLLLLVVFVTHTDMLGIDAGLSSEPLKFLHQYGSLVAPFFFFLILPIFIIRYYANLNVREHDPFWFKKTADPTEDKKNSLGIAEMLILVAACLYGILGSEGGWWLLSEYLAIKATGFTVGAYLLFYAWAMTAMELAIFMCFNGILSNLFRKERNL